MSNAAPKAARLSPVLVACSPVSAACRKPMEPQGGAYYSDTMEKKKVGVANEQK